MYLEQINPPSGFEAHSLDPLDNFVFEMDTLIVCNANDSIWFHVVCVCVCVCVVCVCVVCVCVVCVCTRALCMCACCMCVLSVTSHHSHCPHYHYSWLNTSGFIQDQSEGQVIHSDMK